jgi:hypothetical protein
MVPGLLEEMRETAIPLMRLRMLRRPPIESIDGIQLDCFVVGCEYDVGNSLGALFLAEGWAEPLDLDAPKPPTPYGADDPYDSRVLYPANTPPNLKIDHTPPFYDRDLGADFKWNFRPRRR